MDTIVEKYRTKSDVYKEETMTALIEAIIMIAVCAIGFFLGYNEKPKKNTNTN